MQEELDHWWMESFRIYTEPFFSVIIIQHICCEYVVMHTIKSCHPNHWFGSSKYIISFDWLLRYFCLLLLLEIWQMYFPFHKYKKEKQHYVWEDGSTGKIVCCQTWTSEFSLQDLFNKRWKLTSSSYPLTSTHHLLWHTHTHTRTNVHTHTCTHTQIRKNKWW